MPICISLFCGGTAIETIKKNIGLWVVFDGIGNSVFQSQVLNVASKQCQANVYDKMCILSFEKNILEAKNKLNLLSIPENVEFILAPKLSFFGKISLQSAIEITCNQVFKLFPTKIIARGPLAGYICIKALDKAHNEQILLKDEHSLPKLVIQARGLAKKEYEYMNKFSIWSKIFLPWYWYIARQLGAIEKFVYSEATLSKNPASSKIEAVSQYLADYLIEEFGAQTKRITLAKHDQIEKLPATTIAKNRKEIRSKLGLDSDAKVYCYAGSAKPWQSVKETMELFANKFAENPHAHFLIVSQEKEIFEKLFKKYKIPTQNYSLVSTECDQQYLKTLCAADVGVILREDHLVNWVARPTKVMDYLACGLAVEHNNTVAWVIDEVSIAEADKTLHAKTSEPAAVESIKAATLAPKISIKSEKSKVTKALAKPVSKKAGATSSKAATVKTATTKDKTKTLKATPAKTSVAKKATKKVVAKPAVKSRSKKQAGI